MVNLIFHCPIPVLRANDGCTNVISAKGRHISAISTIVGHTNAISATRAMGRPTISRPNVSVMDTIGDGLGVAPLVVADCATTSAALLAVSVAMGQVLHHW